VKYFCTAHKKNHFKFRHNIIQLLQIQEFLMETFSTVNIPKVNVNAK